MRLRILVGVCVAIVAAVLMTATTSAKDGCGDLWDTYVSDLLQVAYWTETVNNDAQIIADDQANGADPSVVSADVNQAVSDASQKQAAVGNAAFDYGQYKSACY